MSRKSARRTRHTAGRSKPTGHGGTPGTVRQRNDASGATSGLLAQVADAVPTQWLAPTPAAPGDATSTASNPAGAGSIAAGSTGVPAARAAHARQPATSRPTATLSTSLGQPPPERAAPVAATEASTTRPTPVLVPNMPSEPLQVMTWTCAPVKDADPQGLALTYWFDAAPSGEPYPVQVKFSGQRLSDDDKPVPGDSFEVVHTVPRVLPGSGRIALSARVPDIRTGRWRVTATLLSTDSAAPRPGRAAGRAPTVTATGSTMFWPVARARAPGVRLAAWPSLVLTGATGALVVQALLAAQAGMPVGRLLAVSLLACLVGLVGAKVYYLATHRGEPVGALQAGMSVQGFILAAVAILLLGGWTVGIPLGRMLDVTTPGLLFGLMIGRLGCFFGGCCAGRPTTSRWGMWSSDRRLGVRRIPVQLMESALAGVTAVGATVAAVRVDPSVGGLLFVAGLAAYIGGRQVLFPLRDIPRTTAWGRPLTLILAALIFLAAAGLVAASAG